MIYEAIKHCNVQNNKNATDFFLLISNNVLKVGDSRFDLNLFVAPRLIIRA